MALTNGSLYGKFDGQATGNVNNTAWNACNATNPNQQPNRDLFQILGPGGAVLLRVNSAGTVSTNVAAGVATSDAVVAQVQLVAPTGLGASPYGIADYGRDLSTKFPEPEIGHFSGRYGYRHD